jgi:hypothetical protein
VSTAAPSRSARPLVLIGAGILAVLVLIAGAVGWMLFEMKQDRAARAAYEEYQSQKNEYDAAIIPLAARSELFAGPWAR